MSAPSVSEKDGEFVGVTATGRNAKLAQWAFSRVK